MEQRQTKRIKTISEFHRLRGLATPEHPLISVVDYSEIARPANISEMNWVFDFYQISIKRGVNAKIKYGQQPYDFDEGIMFFISPNQVFRIEPEHPKAKRSGWILLLHPDFIWGTSLAKNIKRYEFFNYSVNEALFLSEKEEKTIMGIVDNIWQEYRSNIDKYSKQIIVTHIENLLSYCDRFCNRQFITREKTNHQILDSLEKILADYFESDDLMLKGLLTVQDVSDRLHISVSYLSRLLKTLTGQSTQQFIHAKLIDKAMEKLSTTDLSVSEIAYELGFGQPQAFSKLFKNKTNQSPLTFRNSFNLYPIK